ncbi:Structural maintenance of chromosomes protein 4, partial [Stegodyphus mimosarum]
MQPKGSNDNETGMLEYVEDVIGSSRFIGPIKTIEGKLKTLGEEKEVKLNQLKMAQKAKDELEDPKNKAIEFLKLENKLYLLEHSLLHVNRFETETELETIIKGKEDLVNEIGALKKKLESVRASKKSIDCELHELNGHYDGLLKTVEESKEKYKELERQDVAYDEDMKHAKNKIEVFEKNLETLKNERNKLAKQLTTYEKETIELTEMKKKHEAEKSVEETK